MIPDVSSSDAEIIETPSKTWRLDLDNNRITGYIDGLDAVLQSAFMALQTARYQYLIFSWQYGSELATLVGKDSDYIVSEAKRMITDALSTDTRITDIRDFRISDDVIFFTIDTIFGTKETQWEVTTA